MKIERPRPQSTGRVVSARSAEAASRAYGAQDSTVSGPRPSADVATIAGLSETELTPKVRQALDMLMTEVQSMREELSQARHRISYLKKLADEDTLVPIANRRAFVREMSRMVAYAERYGSDTSVLYFDINGFNEINDSYGHAAGDATLLFAAIENTPFQWEGNSLSLSVSFGAYSFSGGGRMRAKPCRGPIRRCTNRNRIARPVSPVFRR